MPTVKRYTLVIEADRRREDPEGHRRLRLLLKRLLRSLGLVCIEIRPAERDAEPEAPSF